MSSATCSFTMQLSTEKMFLVTHYERRMVASKSWSLKANDLLKRTEVLLMILLFFSVVKSVWYIGCGEVFVCLHPFCGKLFF